MANYKIKTILFPTDFSAAADNALDFAVSIAKKCAAKIILVNVVESPVFTTPDGGYAEMGFVTEEMVKESKDLLRTMAHSIIARHKIPVERYSLQGLFYENAIRAAFIHDADLIVMGTEKEQGVSNALFGSKAFRIVSYSPVPVLTVNSEIKWTDVSKIIFPLNEDRMTLQKAHEVGYLAKLFDAEVLLLGIFSDNVKAQLVAEHLDEVNTVFTDKGIKASIKLFLGSNYSDEILKLCNSTENAIVSVAALQEHGILSLFHQKHDKKLINQAPLPVFSVPYTNIEKA